jgi:hypothetical protein
MVFWAGTTKNKWKDIGHEYSRQWEKQCVGFQGIKKNNSGNK